MHVRRYIAFVCVAVVIATEAYAQPAQNRQLVVPFENAGEEPRVHWLGEGSAVLLTDDLLALGVPAITRGDRVRAFERLRVPAVATLSHATVIRVAQVLGAARVIVGSFELREETLVVRARSIAIEPGQISPEIIEQGPLSDVFAIYGRVAQRLAPESRVSLEQMEQGHPPLPAFEQYIKGLLAEAPATKTTYLTGALKAAPGFQRVRLALWDIHTDQGDHQRALAVVREVPATHRLAREARFASAISLVHLGQLQDAYSLFAELNGERPDPALSNNLGVIQLRRPPSPASIRAVVHFGDAARLDASDPDLYFNLGYASWLERDVPSAIAWLREAVRRNPADEHAHYVLGVALQAAGNAAEGTRERELARRLSPEVQQWEKGPAATPVPRGLERLKLEIDVPPSLRVEYAIVTTGQRGQQDLALFHLDSARRLYAAERDSEAISELRKTIYLVPYHSDAHLLLGRIYLRNGRVPEAIDILKISIWSADTTAARLALAEALIAAKDVAAARAELQGIIQRDPANVDARRLLETLP